MELARKRKLHDPTKGPDEDIELAERRIDQYAKCQLGHDASRRAFDEAAARIRLVASRRALRAAMTVEDWLISNVEKALPFSPHRSEAGTAAREGPARVEAEALDVAQEFTRGARRRPDRPPLAPSQEPSVGDGSIPRSCAPGCALTVETFTR